MTASTIGSLTRFCASICLGATFVLLPSASQARQLELQVDAPPRLQGVAERVRRLDFTALERSLAAAGLPMPRSVFVTLVANDDEWAKRTPQWVVGLAGGTSQVAIFPERIGPYPHDSLESVVRHELVHLALNARAARRPLPRWFHEGVAVTIESGWNARDEMRLLVAALDPPSLADIGRLFASDAYPDTTQAYLLAGALVDEIRRRHGADVPGTIAGHVASGMSFDAAFRAATGETVDEAASRAWAGYRRLARWFPVVASPGSVWTLILCLAAVAFVFRFRKRRAQRRRWEEEEADEEFDTGSSS